MTEVRELFWSSSFKRAYKKALKKNPEIKDALMTTLQTMQTDLFCPDLNTHKLSGKLSGLYACSCGYDCRIIFSLKKGESGEGIMLITFGSHDAVY